MKATRSDPRLINGHNNGPCAFDGCERRLWAKGYCNAHYHQVRKGSLLRPVPREVSHRPDGLPSLARDAEGRKRCGRCQRWQVESEFSRDAQAGDGLSNRCRECRVVNRHGMTWDRYAALLDSQGGKCAICRSSPGRRRLAIDHDHDCCPGPFSCGACVRGLLCAACNPAVGALREDPLLFVAALRYLGHGPA